MGTFSENRKTLNYFETKLVEKIENVEKFHENQLVKKLVRSKLMLPICGDAEFMHYTRG